MASIGGRLAKVMYGSVVVAGIGTWSMSGFIPDIAEDTAFGDTVKKWVRAGIDDAGSISFDGLYDPADANGQVALNALSTATTGMANLYFYESTSVFWRVALGGTILLDKFNVVSMSKSGLATVSFSGKVSAKAMERVA
jgi:hypothetical protein